MGYSDVKTTMIYTHTVKNTMKKAAKSLMIINMFTGNFTVKEVSLCKEVCFEGMQ